MLTLSYAGDGHAPTTADRQVNAWHDEHGAVYARAFSGGERHRIDWPGVGTFAFERGSNEVRVAAAPGAARALVDETFVRLLQPIILQVQGWQALHASAVVGRTGVWAFCARSGSGKSTLAYAFHQAGFSQFADDALVLSVTPDGPLAHPLPFTPRLTPPARDFFPMSARRTRLDAHDSPALPLDAIFLLARNAGADEPTRITPLAPAQAFSALLAHAHCFDAANPADVTRLVADYLTVADRVPVLTCRYRPGLSSLPELVGQIERAANGETALA